MYCVRLRVCACVVVINRPLLFVILFFVFVYIFFIYLFALICFDMFLSPSILLCNMLIFMFIGIFPNKPLKLETLWICKANFYKKKDVFHCNVICIGQIERSLGKNEELFILGNVLLFKYGHLTAEALVPLCTGPIPARLEKEKQTILSILLYSTQ